MRVQKQDQKYWIGLDTTEFTDSRNGLIVVNTSHKKFSIQFSIKVKDLDLILYPPNQSIVWLAFRDGFDITQGPVGKGLQSMVEQY